MKQPKMSDVRLDKAGTKTTRKSMSKTKKIKITINFDTKVLEQVKSMSEKTGTPYQTLLNKIVKEALLQKKSETCRLDRLEKEVNKLKKKIAA